jgi:integrase
MLVNEAMKAYAAWRTSAGFATRTVHNDGTVLRRFVQVNGNLPIKKIGAAHVDAHIADLAAVGNGSGTINLHHAHLASFFRWCRQRKLMPIDSDPIAGRRYQKQPVKVHPRVPMAQFGVLLDLCHNPRDRMLVACGLYLLARGGEVVNIRVKDVDLDSSEILVHVRKTKQYDRMPISAELRSELARWLPIYSKAVGGLKPEMHLVPAQHIVGSGEWVLEPYRAILSPEKIVQRALARIGISGERLGFHTLRRSSARALHDEMVALGYDGALRRVSAWLHHSSTAMSEKYLGIDIDKAQRDKEAKDQPMFPSLASPNVIPIGEHRADQAM